MQKRCRVGALDLGGITPPKGTDQTAGIWCYKYILIAESIKSAVRQGLLENEKQTAEKKERQSYRRSQLCRREDA